MSLTVVDPQNPPTAAQQADIAKRNQAFDFDGIGNRNNSTSYDVQGAAVVKSYSSNALNQYSDVGAGVNTRLFDDDGNLLDDGSKQFEWDGENRLIAVKQGAVTIAEYAYDAYSRRITKDVAGVVTNFVYDVWNPIAEYSDSTLSKTYTWGMDVSRSTQGAGGIGGLLAVDDIAEVYYPTFDGSGNVSEYVDSAGTVVAHYEYGTFGQSVVSGAMADDFSHQFSTKPFDIETGLHYYGYRYYDSSNGRWLGRDPIGENGGFNIYGFVGGDPINYYDYLGLDPSDNNWFENRLEDVGYLVIVGGDIGLRNLAYMDECLCVRKTIDDVNIFAPATPSDVEEAIADWENYQATGEISPWVALNLPYLNKLKKCGKIRDLWKKYRKKKPTTPKVSPIPETPKSSKYEIPDEKQSKNAISNRETDVNRSDFEKNLQKSGFEKQEIGGTNNITNLTDSKGNKYTVRDNDKSFGGSAADYAPAGEKKKLKIRLGK